MGFLPPIVYNPNLISATVFCYNFQMKKASELKKIALQIERCKICIKDKIGKAVVGEGNDNARIMFIGEAPGKTESITGRPFVGRSGKFLRLQITSIGLDEKEVYITSPVKYLPIYKTPTDLDIEHGMSHLSKQINIIEPEVIVLMGAVAVRGVLLQKIKISEWHGKGINKNGKTYFISYHPAAAIRFKKIRELFIKDFLKLKKYTKSNS